MGAMPLSEVKRIAELHGPCVSCGGREFSAVPGGWLRRRDLEFVESVERALSLDRGELVEGWACCVSCGQPRAVSSYWS